MEVELNLDGIVEKIKASAERLEKDPKEMLRAREIANLYGKIIAIAKIKVEAAALAHHAKGQPDIPLLGRYLIKYDEPKQIVNV